MNIRKWGTPGYHAYFPPISVAGAPSRPIPQPCNYSDRFQVECYNRIVQQEAYDFYKMWNHFPG